MLGAPVQLRSGGQIGTVKDFIFSPQGDIQFVVVVVQEELIAVPVNVVQLDFVSPIVVVEVERDRFLRFHRFARAADVILLSTMLNFAVQLQSNVAAVRIADFIVADGRINFAVLSFQERFIPVPFNLVQLNVQQQNFAINMSQQQLLQAPSFTKGQMPNMMANTELMNRVNTFFESRTRPSGSEAKPEARPPATRPPENRPPEVRPQENRPPETRPMEKRPPTKAPMEKRPPAKPPAKDSKDDRSPSGNDR
jgi:hypothetical protein